MLNVVVLPPVWDRNYEIARKAIGVVIEGVLEYRDGVTNLVAHRFEDWPVEGTRSQDFSLAPDASRRDTAGAPPRHP